MGVGLGRKQRGDAEKKKKKRKCKPIERTQGGKNQLRKLGDRTGGGKRVIGEYESQLRSGRRGIRFVSEKEGTITCGRNQVTEREICKGGKSESKGGHVASVC